MRERISSGSPDRGAPGASRVPPFVPTGLPMWGSARALSVAPFAKRAFSIRLIPHPRARWLRSVGAWRAVYRGALYASFPFFLLLLAGGCANGLGWPDSREAFRWVLMPFTAVVLLTTAVASMGYWDVGRLSLGFHPVNAVLWALLVVRVCDWLGSAAGGAVQRQPPGACIGPSRTPIPTQAEHRFRAARTP